MKSTERYVDGCEDEDEDCDDGDDGNEFDSAVDNRVTG